MQTTWIIAADSYRARIFQQRDGSDELQEIDDLSNPEGRQQEREIVSDREGRFAGGGSRDQAHTADPRDDAVEHASEMFSKQVGHYLDKACSEHRFDTLCLIAAPKFLGQMRRNLSKQTQDHVEREVAKDISWYAPHDVAGYVRSLNS